MRPIIHISFPVSDMPEAIAFYRQVLGAEIGRHTETFADAFVFGAQVTLQNDPLNVTAPMPRSRHFGATVSWENWEEMASRLRSGDFIVERPIVSHAGHPTEQAKMMLMDPSGNLIEIKAYRQPDKVLGSLAEA
jgi:uncharacterized protein